MIASILTARNVVAGYVPGMPIVHNVSVDVAPGEIVHNNRTERRRQIDVPQGDRWRGAV